MMNGTKDDHIRESLLAIRKLSSDNKGESLLLIREITEIMLSYDEENPEKTANSVISSSQAIRGLLPGMLLCAHEQQNQQARLSDAAVVINTDGACSGNP